MDYDINNNNTILVNLAKLMIVKDNMIKTEDFGSFKKSEDLGFEIRQVSTEALLLFVDKKYKLKTVKAFVSEVVTSLEEMDDNLLKNKMNLFKSLLE